MKKTRFLIFGQSRSGSGLLVDLLNSHPDIQCDSELMNRNGIRSKDIFRRLLIERFPYIYINHQVHKQAGNAYGFKLLFHQLSKYPGIKSKLFNQKWKIIHIRRKDILAQTLSGIIARETGKYHRYRQDVVDDRLFTLDPKTVAKKLNHRSKAKEGELELLNGLNYCDIVYEDDLADSNNWSSSMARVFNYLGVQPCEVSAKILKTDNRANDKRILNYSEILDYLKNNGFGHILK